MKKFDVIIIGGGVVGLILACLLAQDELSIALVDHQPPPDIELKSPYDIRVSAINHATAAIFQSINAWELMQQLRISGYSHMRIWDENSPAQIEFDSTEIGRPYLGYVLEHSVMRQILWRQLQAQDNVQLYSTIAPCALYEKSSVVEIQLNHGERIAAPLLVGADGKDSWVAQQAFLTYATQVAMEYALIATLRAEHPHQQTAWQRFLTTGPVALLPLMEQQWVSLVWSTTAEEARRLQAINDAAFNKTLTQKLGYVLGKLEVYDQRVAFPLVRHQAAHYVKSRIALVGDAAHTILPLAGQGLNLGLLDVACLAQTIMVAHKNGRDIGALTTLRRYERWRRGENGAMLLAMEGFYRLFSSTAESMRGVRHASFALTEKLPWVKRYFIERAMGLRGDLPEIIKITI